MNDKGLKSGLHQALLLMLILLFAYVITYFMNVYLANILGSKLYGDFSVAFRVTYLIAILLPLGADMSASKYLPVFIREQDQHGSSAFVKWCFMSLLRNVLFFLFGVLLFNAIVFAISYYAKLELTKLYHLSILFILVSPLFSVIRLYAAILLSGKRYYLSSLLNNIIPYIFILFCFLILSKLFDFSWSHGEIFFAFLLSFILSVLIATSIFYSKRTLFIKKGATKGKSDFWTRHKEWFSLSLKLAPNPAIYYLLGTIELVMVEIFHKQEASVGYYSAILAISIIPWVIAKAASRYMQPLIHQMLKGSLIDLQKKIHSNAMILVPLIFILTAAIIYFSGPLLTLFGSGFSDARIPLCVFSVGVFMNSISINATLLLSYSGYERETFYTSLATVFLLCILAPFSIHFYGILGMASLSAILLTMKSLFIISYSRIKLELKSCFVI